MEKMWKDEYVKSIGAMKFSEGQKAKMVQFLVDADNAGAEKCPPAWALRKNAKAFLMIPTTITAIFHKMKSRLPIKRLAVAGICICALALGTAGASAGGLLKPVSEVFGNLFHLSGNTSEILDKMGKSLNKSDSSAGVTITADAVIGDEYNYAVVFSIEKEDGTPFDSIMDKAPIENWLFEAASLEEEPLPFANGSWGDSYFEDTNPEDSSVQFVHFRSNDNKVSGKELKAEFSNLGYEKNGEFVKVLDGDWKLNFEMNFPDSTVKLQAGQHFQEDNLNMTIQTVQVSPIGFHIEFKDLDYKEGDDWTEDTEDIAKENAFSGIPIVLTLTDGEKIELTDGSSIRRTEEGGLVYTHGGIFGKIIPVEEMESIRIGDIIIAVLG